MSKEEYYAVRRILKKVWPLVHAALRKFERFMLNISRTQFERRLFCSPVVGRKHSKWGREMHFHLGANINEGTRGKGSGYMCGHSPCECQRSQIIHITPHYSKNKQINKLHIHPLKQT